MKNPDRQHVVTQHPGLTISYKAPVIRPEGMPPSDGPVSLILMDRFLRIQSVSAYKQFPLPLPGSYLGGHLFEILNVSFPGFTREAVLSEINNNGSWSGALSISLTENHIFHGYGRFSLMIDEQEEPNAVLFALFHQSQSPAVHDELHRVENKYQVVVESLSEGVVLINKEGQIETANKKAAEILGIPSPGLAGMAIQSEAWNALRQDETKFPSDEFPAIVSLRTGRDINDVVMGLRREKGDEIWISINSRPIFKENSQTPEAVVASFKDITSERLAWKKVQQSEMLFRGFMSNSPTLAWVYDEFGNLVYANPLFMSRIGLGEQDMGKNIYEFTDPVVARRIMEKNRQVLAHGKPVTTEDQLLLPDGSEKYYLANWFLVPGKYGMMIGGHAIDVTEQKSAEKKLQLMNERFTYVVNASSDAIWDLDLQSNEIYRSDAFCKISGFNREDIESTLQWWSDRIHPEDKLRVEQKIEQNMREGKPNWEDEYRFQHADGSYRFISDKGYTIYQNGIPVRQVGSMQDITERKKLEAQLLHEQVQKQKLINQATIRAQEHERNMISAELHDNVNQLLISSRLFIGIAKNTPEQRDELLDKATNYLLMAVDEIRALSKRMNSKVVSIVGLKESITEIANNMQQHRHIQVELDVDERLSKRLSSAHQLMIFRIVQEQTGNIVKHSQATEARISLQEAGGDVLLDISDNGIGFEYAQSGKVKGIGLINIFNRVDAYNGKVEVDSAPGKGCALHIRFPLQVNSETESDKS